jgi:hypothetical protein
MMDKQEAIVRGMFNAVSDELSKSEYTGVHVLLFASLFVREQFSHLDDDIRVHILRLLADAMGLETTVVPSDPRSIN